jgi:hypothetical protein
MAANVLGSASRPKSSAWLLAMLATSTPAAASAVSADAGAWNVNRLPASGRPPSPTDVSRLTIATSAAPRVAPTGASAVAGSSSRPRSAPSKWTSPATATVTALGAAAGGSGRSPADGEPDEGVVAVGAVVAG